MENSKIVMEELFNKLKEVFSNGELFTLHIKNAFMTMHKTCRRIDNMEIEDDQVYITGPDYDFMFDLDGYSIEYEKEYNTYCVTNSGSEISFCFL